MTTIITPVFWKLATAKSTREPGYVYVFVFVFRGSCSVFRVSCFVLRVHVCACA
jgi:hypothetical protein